jgi:osmotically-inducible protein OsmY
MYDEGGGSSIELWLGEREDAGLDSELQDLVHRELRWERRLDPLSITVEVRDRCVTLGGSVRSYPEKVSAEQAASRVPHVQRVVNQVSVDLPPGTEVPDTALLEEVTRVLGWDALVPADRVRAVVDDGCVTLRGQVDWDHQRIAVEEAVTPLIGVTAVENHITVRPKWMSGELRPEVTATVRHHRELHTQHVRIEAQCGMVVLRGHVPSLAERSAVERAAWSAPGVVGVVNELTIDR